MNDHIKNRNRISRDWLTHAYPELKDELDFYLDHYDMVENEEKEEEREDEY